MKWEITLEADPELLNVRVLGSFSAEGFARMLEDASSHPGWHAAMNTLVDYRSASTTDADYAAIQSAVEAQSRLRVEMGKGRVAALVGDELMYGLGRVYQTLGEGRFDTPISIFREESEARAWLDQGDDVSNTE